jgi:AcrR family transcriptional regulator
MPEVVRPYRGVSAEERRARRRQQLIESMLELVAADGMAGATMTAVCARAGLTERYFYESFSDREALLNAVFDSCMVELDQEMFAALDASAPDLLERCRAAAGAMISVLTDDPRKARFYLEAAGSETLKERRAGAIRAHADVLAGQIRELRGLEEQVYEAPLRLATLVLLAGVAEAIVTWLDGSLEMPREMLIEECARLSVAVADAVHATAPLRR